MKAGLAGGEGGDRTVVGHAGKPGDKKIAPFAIRAAGASQVPFEGTVGDECSEGGLGEMRWLRVDDPACVRQCVDDTWRCDEEPESERGRDRLGEAADVDRAARRVEAVEWFERSIDVAVLGVVVVLDHDGVEFAGTL